MLLQDLKEPIFDSVVGPTLRTVDLRRMSYDLICFWPYMSRSGECLKGVSIFLPVDCGLSADSIYWLVDCGLSADKNDDERPLHSSLA